MRNHYSFYNMAKKVGCLSRAIPLKRNRNLLSFEVDEDDIVKNRLGKDPTVESYEEDKKPRDESDITLDFRFWDGTDNRFSLTVSKSLRIIEFLGLVRDILQQEFTHLKHVYPSALMYVKGDCIMPHDYCFCDIIDIAGKLFDIREAKDEGYPAKILERKWYEKNKHIYPASKWKIFTLDH